MSQTSDSSVLRLVVSVSPFYRWGNWDLGNVSGLPEATQLAGGELAFSLLTRFRVWTLSYHLGLCSQIPLWLCWAVFGTDYLQTCHRPALAVCAPSHFPFLSCVPLSFTRPSDTFPSCLYPFLWILKHISLLSRRILTLINWFYVVFDNDRGGLGLNTI